MLKVSEIHEKVLELIRQYPDAIYCPPKNNPGVNAYFSGVVKNGPKTEGCIIGQAIRLLIPLNECPVIYAESVQTLVDSGKIHNDNTKLLDCLCLIQDNQDGNNAWKDCLD